jgi:hypothetical protein
MRLMIASLGQRCDGADFDETESKSRQSVYACAILVESGGKADRIGE